MSIDIPGDRSAIEGYPLIAYRGMSDRLAPPNTIGAFKRSVIKRIPFLIDLTSGAFDLNDIMIEDLLGNHGVPVFIKYVEPGILPWSGSMADKSPIYFINCSNYDKYILEIKRKTDPVNFETCGAYLPLNHYLTRQHERGHDALGIDNVDIFMERVNII